ncbi:hypothetical protein EVAR_39790_1 [Eumeta japonica]|uniref:Uncharacterized protein n=1 Tax=Eumeta variegata TaxID=151549 RepID=A0A4C1X4K4_EUMVA|nr:hypothetical protein EVAR_39790_1 [Eumeta japonica]
MNKLYTVRASHLVEITKPSASGGRSSLRATDDRLFETGGAGRDRVGRGEMPRRGRASDRRRPRAGRARPLERERPLCTRNDIVACGRPPL